MTTLTAELAPSANCLADEVEMGEGCVIGRYVVIERDVRLGERVLIGDGSFIGEGSRIGDDTRIGERVTIRENTWIGKKVIIESGACLGCDGFGFAQRTDGTQFKIPQVGIVEICDGCTIHARATIDRATLGKTLLKERVTVGPLVMVGHNVKIGEDCFLDAQSGVSGSTQIEKGTRVGRQEGLVGHLKVGAGCRVESYTGVTKSLAPNTHLKGLFPAMSPELFDKHQELVTRIPDLTARLEKLEQTTVTTV